MEFANLDKNNFANRKGTSCDIFCSAARAWESLSLPALVGTSFGFGVLIVSVALALVLCCFFPGLVFASCIARQQRVREVRRRRRTVVRFAEPESTVIELREQAAVAAEVARPEHTYQLSRYSGPRVRGLRAAARA